MKLVKCKSSNHFLIKDECYEVISINYYDEEKLAHMNLSTTQIKDGIPVGTTNLTFIH